MVPQWQLRAEFARRLSDMYGREVPAYTTLVEASRDVNDHVLRTTGAEGERFGSIERVTAERHGAIRLGTQGELRAVATIFAALGMHPVGCYGLRSAASSAVPVVSTAVRSIDADELARNPFRMFTSVLTTDDRRFFDQDPQAMLEAFLGSFPQNCSNWPTLPSNHLTPRVLDIDELYRGMSARGNTMIDTIQGPPRWNGPDVLLRQTSFRALAEARVLREPDGSSTLGALRVRFGEVEARGIALTPAGRARCDALMAEIDERATGHPAENRAELASAAWQRGFPDTERGLLDHGVAYFEYHRTGTAQLPHAANLTDLLDQGLVTAEPITNEDFLPRSAAGIFQSNLTDAGTRDDGQPVARYDTDWLAATIDRPVHDPFDLYERQQRRSVARLFRRDSEPILT
jgi:uncharacterized glyoxalase superfamily metalloenzyme YdcJ